MIGILNYKDHNDNSREISYNIYYGPFPNKKNKIAAISHFTITKSKEKTHWYHLVNKPLRWKTQLS